MIIDINPILKCETNELQVDYYLTIDESVEDISFPGKISVTGSVKNMAGYITLTLDADVKYETACARCLAPIKAEKSISLNKTVITNAEDFQDTENDDYIVSEDGYIDSDETLIEQIVLELPLRHLCKPDCKGLCPKCGADLNAGECGCDTTEPDPRFDVLRKLLEKE